MIFFKEDKNNAKVKNIEDKIPDIKNLASRYTTSWERPLKIP